MLTFFTFTVKINQCRKLDILSRCWQISHTEQWDLLVTSITSVTFSSAVLQGSPEGSHIQSKALNPEVPWWTHYQSFPLSVCALMALPSQLILPCHVNCSWNPADSGIPSIKALWLSLPESQPLQLLHFQQWEHIKEVWRQLLTYQAAILAIKKGLRRQWVEQSVLVDKDKTIACNYHAANDYIGS